MNRIAIIIPYFGKLPNWMDIFLMSAANNRKIDFLIFTDDASIHSLTYASAKNIIIQNWNFEQIQNLVKEKLQGVLPRAYKLCDYRPCYGYLFSDFLHGYDYWGHCDVDTVLGDIMSFLKSVNYQKYERLFLHGHFILYKNSDSMNKLFMEPVPKELPPTMKFNFVRKTCYACHYDEVGINLLCSFYEKKFCKTEISYDVSYYYESFRLSKHKPNIAPLVTYEDGHIYGYELDTMTEEIYRKEYGYVHFMRRRFASQQCIPNKRLAITHKGFIHLEKNEEITPEYILSYSGEKPPTREPYLLQIQRSTLRKLYDLFILDFKVRGLLALNTIVAVYQGIAFIKRNGNDNIYDSPWFNGTINYKTH